ncbi:Retrovirus-related Pol polyprotein from transposon 17.6 [Vitis vinifera]|uniref:Retrovirus-related Pol polyprotein from transposon 17.6 n=1 Tax=Vitis vinifera TaxID=29760 RepID=A0A438H074_VITVI|nr:Retrovirus-related Pol polyprotein from transposon 17.6 [Vitis vinifera]
MGSLQLLNSLKAKLMPKTPQRKWLMYVEALVNGKTTKALVDSGATHNFVSEDEAKRLELQASKEEGWLKTVNSTAKPSHRVARGVAMHNGFWEGRFNFIVAPMDDFKMVLGMDFLQKVKVVPLPFLCSMAILEEEKPCMVPTVTEGTPKTPMLSAMQVKKGLKRKEVAYLATLKKERDDRREEDHKIELEPRAKPPAMGPYRMAPHELEELRRQLKEFLEARFIKPSKAPYGALVLFQKKHDGSLRMCIDYRALNKVTVKNKYPIPLIADLFDHLGRARYFTKLNLRSDYYQVRITKGDEPKTTSVTRYGSYDFLVMPFGLTNAPTTFCTLMNKIFHPYLDKFVVVYLDDIIIYGNTLKEHVEHLRKVFKILRQNELYMKKEKCSFSKEEVSFLGHRIKDGKLMMNGSKVKAIQEWDPPTKVPQLRSFLGLVNYYWLFIKGYSTRATPLTDSFKKNKAWEWDEMCQHVFEDLNKAVTEEPVLALPDHTKVFEVHIDASDFAIGGVLMQDRHPIVYESRKLNNTERLYTVQKKEMTKKLSPKQARWQDFLAKFDYMLEYKPRRANHVADALSRKTKLASMMSQPQGDIMDLLREGLQHDPVAKSLIALAHEGKTKRNVMKPSGLGTLGNDAQGHYLSQLTTGLKYGMKLSVTMDFIIGLPKSEDNDSIIVVGDRFSKYVTFIAALTDCTAEETTRLFLKHVVKYWGLFKYIISDRDPRFTGKFWTEFFKLMGSELHFSTSFHPQIDGQIERVNTLLELYLKHFMSANQKD